MWSIWPASSLRKLAPEEIAMHTGTWEYKMQEFQVATSKGMAVISRLLAPIVEKHVEDATKRLSDIESRMDSIGPSHAELLGDVEALAEKVGAIEKAIVDLRRSHVSLDGQMTDHLNDDLFEGDIIDIKKRLNFLEAYQRGEMPEVCEGHEKTIGEIMQEKQDYFNDIAKKLLDGLNDYREKTEVIDRERIDIPVGACFSVEKKPNEGVSVTYSDGGIELAKMVLDSRREARGYGNNLSNVWRKRHYRRS
jgi:hypothetical protein